MSSPKKKYENICDKCVKQSDCEYKPDKGTLILIRCLDFVAKGNTEGGK